MKTKNLLKYIIIGIVCAALFLLAFAFIETLLHPEKTLADGFKSIFDYILAIVFGVSVASAVWKKDNQGEKKQYAVSLAASVSSTSVKEVEILCIRN